MPERNKRRWIFLFGLIIGGVLAAFGALITAYMIEETSGGEFCTSCHEMEVFGETWIAGRHGPGRDGTVAAKCTDCHLPHEGVLPNLTKKAMLGANDAYVHYFGTEPDWIENLEHRDEFTFDSGCKKCHVELVAPDIPLKAFLAHRDYLTGETEKTCISCHTDVGHKNLIEHLQKQMKQES